MSIATRIEAIEQHLTDDYSVLTLAGADLTNVNKNIVNLKPSWKERLLYFMNNGTQVVWNNWNKVNGTGTSLTLNNTEEAPMSLTYKGNTSQEGTPTPTTPIPIQVVSGDNSIEVSNGTQSASYPISLGVENLLEITNTSQTINGVEFRVNDDKSITINGTASANTNFTLLGNDGTATQVLLLKASTPYYNTTGMRLVYRLVGGGYGAINSGAITPNDDLSIRHVYLSITSGTTINNQTIYPQIIKGTTAKPYNQYGKYIELCKIGTYQDKIDKSTGKNIWNEQWENGYYNRTTGAKGTGNTYIRSTDYIPVEASSTIYFNKPSDFTNYAVIFYDNTKTITGTIPAPTRTNSEAIEVPSTASYFTFYGDTGVANATYKNNVIITYGTQATPYEPYGTSWYVKKEIGKVVLNGSESWNYIAPTVSTDYSYFFTTSYDSILLPNVFTGLCNRFTNYGTYLAPSRQVSSECFSNGDSTICLRFFVDKTRASNTTQWSTYLSNNNVIIYSPLKTPTYETITDTTLLSQLEALKKSYEGQTNISQINNDLPFELDVVALGVM